jgi:hypothetical protein
LSRHPPRQIKAMIFVSGSLGMSLSMCHMSVNKFASATAISVAGNLNKVPTCLVYYYNSA